MPIDPSVTLGADLGSVDFAWTPSDVLLYHLAIGAGARPGDQCDRGALRYTLDDDRLQVLPSFGVVAPSFHQTDPPPLSIPGARLSLSQVLHGSQEIVLHRPLESSGSATLSTRVSELWDKGKAAVIVQEGTATDPSGDPLWTVRSSIFARGEGGWGGDRGPSSATALPDRAPDAEASYTTTPQQALLYRLCGDRNPLHADPDFAAAAGFPAPILHGLCSWGIVLRLATDAALDGDAGRVRGFAARFAGVVFPEDTIAARIWRAADDLLVVDARIAGGERDGSPVLADCTVRHA